MEQKHILVLGAGSVGKRHLRNFAELGCRVSAMDPRSDRLHEAQNEVSLSKRFGSVDEISDHWREFDGVVIGSPPKFHVDQCIAVAKAGLPILLEKPLCRSLEEAQGLLRFMEERPEVPFLLGYTYRWWRPLAEFKRQISRVGQPLHATFVMSANLADWHPWERYQDFFMASRDLGGGALLDESHFLDLMLWFFGLPESIYGRVEKLSSLEIDTDDNVDIIACYQDGLRVSMHLDLYGRPHQKYISISGEQGTLEWSFDPNRVRFSRDVAGEWEESSYTLERNDMFIEVAKEFLRIIDNETDLTCSLLNGVDVMRMIEAASRSSTEGREIKLSEVGER